MADTEQTVHKGIVQGGSRRSRVWDAGLSRRRSDDALLVATRCRTLNLLWACSMYTRLDRARRAGCDHVRGRRIAAFKRVVSANPRLRQPCSCLGGGTPIFHSSSTARPTPHCSFERVRWSLSIKSCLSSTTRLGFGMISGSGCGPVARISCNFGRMDGLLRALT